MNTQYTVKNFRIPGCPVVIRTHSRDQVLGWAYMRVTPNCLDRFGARIRMAEQRAKKPMQYGLPGFSKDKYIEA